MSTMNLIDISSHQSGMDLAKMFRLNPGLDGVIVKISEGTGYVNPDAKAWLDWLAANGKPAGTYHYLRKAGAAAEARYYVEHVKPWLGKVALAVDYEEDTLSMGTGYVKTFLDEVQRLTGVKPLVYCSQIQTLEAQDFREIATAGYPLWVAQYPNHNPVRGFLTDPWHTGTSAPFSRYTMRQYTDSGYLNGWENNLDFDLLYGSTSDWAALYNGTAPEPTPAPQPAPGKMGPDQSVISDVLHGKYGNGQDRISRLETAGYDADAVQRKINELYGIALSWKKKLGDNDQYINSVLYIMRNL